jgi:ATP-binding cassette subfamily F protein uup
MALRSFAASRLGKDVYDAENITVRIGDRTLFDGITWLLGPGDRIGLVGVNGAGKTTLLRALLGDVVPDGGRVKVGASVRPALLSQEVAELPASLRALEAVEQVGRSLEVERGRERSAGQLLEQFGLPSSRQWTRVGDLSGGERRRLQLLRLLMARPNVLLLDEPTNDLDTDTLTALEDLLDSWPGTLVVVSHDRYFLERTCDVTMALLGDGHLRMLPGGIEEYLARRAAAGSEPAASTPSARGATAGGTRGSGGRDGAGGARTGQTAPGVPASTAAASGPAAASTAAAGTAAAATGTVSGPSRSGGELRAARKELTRLERALDRLTRREQELHHALAEAATDHERLLALDAELRAVVADKDGTEEAWLTLAAELEG